MASGVIHLQVNDYVQTSMNVIKKIYFLNISEYLFAADFP